MDEIILRTKGMREIRLRELKELYRHTQIQALFTLAASGRMKKYDFQKPIDQIIPNIYEKSTTQEDLKEMFEKKREQARRRMSKLKNIGKRA